MKSKWHNLALSLLAMISLGLGLNLGTVCAQGARRTASPQKQPKTSSWRFDAWGRGEEVVKLLEKLKAEDPQEYDRLEQLRKSDVEKFFREIRSRLPRRDGFTSKISPIEQRCQELSRSYLAAKDDAEKARIEAELRKALKESFDLVISDAQARIERLQKQVGDLQAKEERILAERLQMFLSGEQDGALAPPSEP
ncbi:MAG TPA: hypothetical protein PKY10_16400 [Lentisphaeria bacterium]|nr:hypothetical protein [Lentisphaeria bacterium]